MNGEEERDYLVTEVFDECLCRIYKVLIVEDHWIVREGTKRLLCQVLNETTSRLDIFEASTLFEARRIVAKHSGQLDLVVLDLELPDGHGEDSIACVRNEWFGVPIAVMSASEDWPQALELMRLGVLGYIPKKSGAEIMLNALRLIFAGGRYFPEEVFRLFEGEIDVHGSIEQVQIGEVEGSAPRGLLTDILSPRQQDVLSLMLKGYANKEIARQLNLSVGTTKNYVANVMRILGVSSRVKVVRAAMLRGVQLDPVSD